MDEHATWFIDLPTLADDLSVAGGPDESTWDWGRLRGLIDKVLSTPSAETSRYLSLLRWSPSDDEATAQLLEHFRDDLPRWFQVVMAPALSPAGSISAHPSLLPPMLEASGWPHADAVSLLMGDPLASLARELGLPVIASQLTEARTHGWLATDRIADLSAALNKILAQPADAIRATATATAADWSQHKAESAATKLLDEARILLERANSERRPLRVVCDF